MPERMPLYMKKEPKTYEWYTPADMVDRVVATLGHIDLDPCSNKQKSIPALQHLTKEDDGLSKEWNGKVFMNPPWGAPLKLWAAKLVSEVEAGRVTEAISLTPALALNRVWFNRFFVGQAQVFVRGPVKFWNDTTDDKNPGWPFPIMLQYFGPNRKKFIEHFGDLGMVVRRVTPQAALEDLPLFAAAAKSNEQAAMEVGEWPAPEDVGCGRQAVSL